MRFFLSTCKTSWSKSNFRISIIKNKAFNWCIYTCTCSKLHMYSDKSRLLYISSSSISWYCMIQAFVVLNILDHLMSLIIIVIIASDHKVFFKMKISRTTVHVHTNVCTNIQNVDDYARNFIGPLCPQFNYFNWSNTVYHITGNIGGELNLAVEAWTAKLSSTNIFVPGKPDWLGWPIVNFKSCQYFLMPGLEPNCQI